MSGKLDFVYVLEKTVAYLKMLAPGAFEVLLNARCKKEIIIGRQYAVVNLIDIDNTDIVGFVIFHSNFRKGGLEIRQTHGEVLRIDSKTDALKVEILSLSQIPELNKRYSICLM